MNCVVGLPIEVKNVTPAATPEVAPISKPKKFFKSRNAESSAADQHPLDATTCEITATYGGPNKRHKLSTDNKSPRTNPKRFFSSTTMTTTTTTTPASSSKMAVCDVDVKPPIVLRICRGKSQLVNDSDESESTPTPSSTPSTSTVTSPRAASRENHSQKSPGGGGTVGPMRMTRSTRRSMQQDTSGGSPATGDTATDTFSALFTSPKKDFDLSPQYIPAEKYELERKALYDNLLGVSTVSENDNEIVETQVEQHMEDECDNVESEGDGNKGPVPVGGECADVLSEGPPEINLPNEVGKIAEEDWSTSDYDSDTQRVKTPPASATTMPTAVIEQRDAVDVCSEEQVSAVTSSSVKLVISKKKGSIFKSRVADGSKKGRALYRHKWCDDKDGANALQNKEGGGTSGGHGPVVPVDCEDEFTFSNQPLTRISNSEQGDTTYTSIKCTKNDKGVSRLKFLYLLLFIISYFKDKIFYIFLYEW